MGAALGRWAGPYQVARRVRPITISRPAGPGTPLAPYLALESAENRVELSTGGGPIAAEWDGVRLAVHAGGRRFVSRRSSRVDRPDRVAVTVTGWHATALAQRDGVWTAHAKVDLRNVGIDPHHDAWLAGVDPATPRFGQLGLRDVRVVTNADGTPHGDQIHLSATSAGPGFFDTAHTSIWRLDPATLEVCHTADLFFRRHDQGGVFGDHATHVVRDGDRWLVATSTWGDFELRRGHTPSLNVTLATTEADVLTGVHVLDTVPLNLPAPADAVGLWDPHLVRDETGWLVGYVRARRFFDFAPVVASGTALDSLRLRAVAAGRTATEGTTLWRDEHTGEWLVLASDGPDSPRRLRRRHPVLDLDMNERGTLATPYPSNIPWPTLITVPAHLPSAGENLLVTFDGTPTAGRVAGYGSHGDLVIARQHHR